MSGGSSAVAPPCRCDPRTGARSEGGREPMSLLKEIAMHSARWLLCLCAGSSAACVLADGPATQPASDPRARMVKRFDKDGDGKLNAAELATAKKAMMAHRSKPSGGGIAATIQKEMLGEFDTNKDGTLDEAEKATATKVLFERRWATLDPKQRAALLARYDKDGDGRLSEAERAGIHETAMGSAPAGAPPKAGMAPSTADLIAKFDREKDGKLDAWEMTDLFRAMRMRPPHKRPPASVAKASDAGSAVGEITPVPPKVWEQVLAECDTNGNKKIDDDEWPDASRVLDEKMAAVEAGRAKGGRISRFDPPDPTALSRVREFDKDHDGKLNATELDAMVARGHGGGGMPGGPRGSMRKGRMAELMKKMIRRYDKDGDGKLNDAERAALRAAMRGMAGKKSPH